MATILDKLITILGFEVDHTALKRFDDRLSATRKRLDGISSAAFSMGRDLTVAGGIGVAAFGVAAKAAIELGV